MAHLYTYFWNKYEQEKANITISKVLIVFFTEIRQHLHMCHTQGYINTHFYSRIVNVTYDLWGTKWGNSAKLLWKWGKPACFHTKTSDAVARCNHRDSIISLCCNILPGFLPTCLCWQRHVTSRRGYLSHRVRVATTKGGSILLNYPNHVNTKSSMTKFMKRNFTSHTFQLKYCLRIRKQHTFFPCPYLRNYQSG